MLETLNAYKGLVVLDLLLSLSTITNSHRENKPNKSSNI